MIYINYQPLLIRENSFLQAKQSMMGAASYMSKSPVGGTSGAPLPISDSNVSTTNDSPAADNDWEPTEMNVRTFATYYESINYCR